MKLPLTLTALAVLALVALVRRRPLARDVAADVSWHVGRALEARERCMLAAAGVR